MTQSIEQLYFDNHQWLRTWLTRKVSCPVLAADLMQDTFERLLRRSQVSNNFQRPRGYLTQIAKGLMVDYWRRKDIEQAYLATLESYPVAQTLCEQTRYEMLEALLLIDKALKRLPARTREVFLKVQLDGVKYRELAQLYQVTERTIKSDVAKALFACLQVDLEG
ncbi:sigma-70 family RNA polymerase sigma factor [Thiomicrospira sp. R3]|uniref:sigma-70 family RNA polymerase sigma factor n=1 Tax=Thiomicrospira sp. R3 TaxID=3035472 RepID=UPI00259BE9AD|nr:sigma-70 family RNA polymerase sigma factor [Thiomicrospira sp. R3]WFE69689.1 sigma-70 family RNA polymerase sigma factor [Thiomicrospira sp. R3]